MRLAQADGPSISARRPRSVAPPRARPSSAPYLASRAGIADRAVAALERILEAYFLELASGQLAGLSHTCTGSAVGLLMAAATPASAPSRHDRIRDA